jgi:hypothetical protein
MLISRQVLLLKRSRIVLNRDRYGASQNLQLLLSIAIHVIIFTLGLIIHQGSEKRYNVPEEHSKMETTDITADLSIQGGGSSRLLPW